MIFQINKNFKLISAFKTFLTLSNIVIFSTSLFVVSSSTKLSNNEFDHLIFTQRWLPTSCLSIKEKCKSSNCCHLPDDYKVWSIHGLWPQQKNSYGPFFCNHSIPFNSSMIELIRPKLKKFWCNIEKKHDSTSLWKHEWLKHGTCAVKLEKLNNEFKYFNTSLNFFENINMNKVFQAIKIFPSNNGVNITDLFDKITNELGKKPFLHCITEAKSGDAYLIEVRLCYNLNLKLINCEIFNDNELKTTLTHSMTNCPTESLIKFPPSVVFLSDSQNNALKSKYKRYLHYQNLNDLLKIVRFLSWVSL